MLSVEGTVFEESLFSVLSSKIFPNLEILRVKAPKLEIKLSVLRQKLDLPKIKKLDLRECDIKDDMNTESSAFDLSRNPIIQRKIEYLKELKEIIILTLY